MNDHARNTRTLIVSFVVAIMALIPLRFVEVGQLASGQQVLGEVAQEVASDQLVLEAPYNQIEAEQVLGVIDECISREEAELVLGNYQEQIDNEELDIDQVNKMVEEMNLVESAVCL